MAEDILQQFLQPVIGEACALSAVKCLEELNPELKNNDDLKTKFIKEINKYPAQDKSYVVAAAIKISKIKNVMAENGDNSEFSGAYKDFESITTRLLKNFYNMAKYADSVLYDETLSDDTKIDVLTGPLASARTIVFNDSIRSDITAIQKANEEMDMLVRSSAGGIEKFPLLVQYAAERSAQTAQIIFDHKEYRNFSEWNKKKTIEDAKSEALKGTKDKNINMTPIIVRGIQNG